MSDLGKNVVLEEFKKSKRKYLHIREWKEVDVISFLIEMGFKNNIFVNIQKNKIDGKCFIHLMTHIDRTIEIFGDLGFSHHEISNLFFYYLDIFNFRKLYAPNFKNDESPSYSTNFKF
eukprot:TRINITY_DN5752_c0_g1_i1.p1 TRINITY_DN5752_c0_g1~~TRINITY_DN5752_c0_g1_i1.p1  ORF type:complete len:118 (-),score=20.44 TRINITY_DN5752_c0_g1_i1:33-386(-)